MPSLGGIRAVCIALVLGEHAAQSMGFPDRWKPIASGLFNGSLGVTVFFVLSGFLITFLLIAEERAAGRISLRAFYARRALRILPVYGAYVAALVVLDRATTLDLSLCDYVTTLTYTKDFACGQWIDGHLWSLSVEQQFYLLWPMALVCLRRRGRRWVMATCIVLAPICRVVFFLNGWYDLEVFSLMANADALMIGAAAGIAYFERGAALQTLLRFRPALVRGVAVALMWMLMVLDHFVSGATSAVAFGGTVTALAAAYLIVSYASCPGGPVYAMLNWRPVRYVGALSYSLYIWQQPFFNGYDSYGYAPTPAVLRFPLNVVAAFAVAAVSYHALEMPVLSLRKKFRPLRPRDDRPHLEPERSTSPL